MPSIALSNSTSFARFQVSVSRIRSEMNYDHKAGCQATDIKAEDGQGAPYVQKIIDNLHLVADRERSLSEIAEKPDIDCNVYTYTDGKR